MNFKIVKAVFFCQLVFFLLASGFYVVAQSTPAGTDIGTVNATSESGQNKIAPGEVLPVSVKLVNFGSQKRVDVIINYKILDNDNKEIYSESETVAVETTASFIKQIRLPDAVSHGQYTVETILNYPYQTQPAVSDFKITVEEKIGGFFESDLIFYSIIIIPLILALFVFIYLFSVWKQKHLVSIYDYSNKPKDQIIYYEILGDMIRQMRLRIGNEALEIAKNIPDLEINDKNGMIVNIKKDPVKIIALLVQRYEKLSGHKISFALPKSNNKL